MKKAEQTEQTVNQIPGLQRINLSAYFKELLELNTLISHLNVHLQSVDPKKENHKRYVLLDQLQRWEKRVREIKNGYDSKNGNKFRRCWKWR